MPELLHEYWENEDGGQFGPVSAERDQSLPTITPGAKLIFSLWASSWYQAMQLYNGRLDYGDFIPGKGVPDNFYSDEDASDQAAYLQVRNVHHPKRT